MGKKESSRELVNLLGNRILEDKFSVHSKTATLGKLATLALPGSKYKILVHIIKSLKIN